MSEVHQPQMVSCLTITRRSSDDLEQREVIAVLDGEDREFKPENCYFALTGTELVAGRTAYVLEVEPKRSEKYLVQCRIWVDTEDCTLARAECQPAKKPSVWTKNIHFVRICQKCASLWFPLSTQSVTEAHLCGTTGVSIDYFDYAPEMLNPLDVSVMSMQPRVKL